MKKCFAVSRSPQLHIGYNFQKGIILSRMLVKLHFSNSAHCLMMLYICTKFRENISNDRVDTIFVLQLSYDPLFLHIA